MASSRRSIREIDLTDVAVAWAAFEDINQVKVAMRLTRTSRQGTPEPMLSAEALNTAPANGAAKRWGSVNAISWVMNHKSLDTAVFHLLYTLDGLIASAELNHADEKKA